MEIQVNHHSLDVAINPIFDWLDRIKNQQYSFLEISFEPHLIVSTWMDLV